MRVLVRLLGHARLELRCKEVELELPQEASIHDAVARLLEMLGTRAEEALVNRVHGGYSVLFSLNGHSADPAALLSDGDVVTLLPPMAGGELRALDPKVCLLKATALGDEAHV
ncbi:MAG: MoaD/ThiS family protein [Chloroflexi bacterium]|nr:MoaD/ThiS family protein [Chloroflexota bacterium]